MTLTDHLRSLEEQLLNPATRTSASGLTHLLAPEFVEFGSSGRHLTRTEIIAALASDPPTGSLHLSDFHLHASTPSWALVTYRCPRQNASGTKHTSLRSSTWVHRDDRWQLLFHQGTCEPRQRYPELVPLPHTLAALLRFWPLPTDASAHGTALDRHLLLNLWIILALAALAHILILFGLLVRQRTTPTEPAHDRFHKLRLEYLPLAALTVLFGALAVHAERLWAATRYTGADPSALQVEATGMQFAWYFRYPGPDYTFGRTSSALVDPGAGNPLGIDPADPHGTDDLTTSELVLPANREVDLTLHAVDVIHGFAIPELRLKQNAVPGQTLHIHFTPTTPGTYAILCTQLCGSGHFRMNATLRILLPEDFAAWLSKQSFRTAP